MEENSGIDMGTPINILLEATTSSNLIDGPALSHCLAKLESNFNGWPVEKQLKSQRRK